MQKIAIVGFVVFGSLFWCYDPTSAAPEKSSDTIMDEILEVMRQYRLHNGDDTDTITESMYNLAICDCIVIIHPFLFSYNSTTTTE